MGATLPCVDAERQPQRLRFETLARERIDAVVTAHATVRQLLLNGWLHLLRIDPQTGAIEDYAVPA